MRQYPRFAVRLAALALGLMPLSNAFATGTCTIDGERLYRGERSPFMICGADISANARLDGLEESGISVDYSQRIKRCAPDRKEPGLYVWLSAGAAAHSANAVVRNPETGEAACADLSIEVPEMVRLGDAQLRPVRHPDGGVYRLDVVAGKSGSLDEACAGGLEFPVSSRTPSLRLLTHAEVSFITGDSGKFGPKKWYSLPQSTARTKKGPVESLSCTKNRLTAYVRAIGQQRFAAKIVVPNLGGSRTGQAGIAYASLPPPDWAESMRDKDAKFIEVNGYRTRYFDKGKGPDVLVLVHGGQPDPMSPTAQAWRPNFDALAEEFRVIAFDNLGHGYTENPRNADEYATYYERAAQHLYDLIQALDLRRVHLVGHSQGGWPVMRVALDHPALVRCVVSAGSVLAPFTPESRGVKNFAYMIFNITPASGPTVESLYRGDEYVGYTANNLLWSEVIERFELSKRPQLHAGQAGMAAVRMSPGHPVFQKIREDALAELAAGKLKVPHLVIWGRNDPMGDYELGLKFYEIASASAARTDLRVFNRAGHSMMVEYPEAFNEAVTGFCGAYRSQTD